MDDKVLVYETGILAHHGVKGQRWGVRRYQNDDGSLTDAGKKRYGIQNYDKAVKAKTYAGFARNADKAAARAGRAAINDNVKNKKTLLKKMSAKYGAEAHITMGKARAKMYDKISENMWHRRDKKLKERAIAAKAAAANNRNDAALASKVKNGKTFTDRAKAAMALSHAMVTKYSKVGRKYCVFSERIRNMLTLGTYSFLANIAYTNKYDQKERYGKTGK